MGHLSLKCMHNLSFMLCAMAEPTLYVRECACVSRFAKLYFKHIELKLNVNDTILRKKFSALYVNVNVFSHKSKSIMKSLSIEFNR